MPSAARQPLGGWRNEACAIPITLPGVDLTGVETRAQIRPSTDNPILTLNLPSGVAAGATGIAQLPVTRDANGVPTSHLIFQISEADMQSLPYAGEIGDAWVGSYALKIGGKTRLSGPFGALASAIDSDAAPANRPSGFNLLSCTPPLLNDVTLTIGDAGVTVDVDGLDLLSPLLSQAASAADAATAAAVTAGGAAASALSSKAAALGAASAIALAIVGYPNGATLTVPTASRLVLAAIHNPAGCAFLYETGRIGSFVWIAGDMSATVQADPRQGICVPPSSDTSGKSGAWMRDLACQPLTNMMFGAVADGRRADGSINANPTDNNTAHAAMLAVARFLAAATNGPAHRCVIEQGSFYDSGTHRIETQYTIEAAAGSGLEGGSASEIIWPANIHGFRCDHYPTSSSGNTSASGTIFRRLTFTALGAGALLSSLAAGIRSQTRITAEDCVFNGFAADGVQIIANEGTGSEYSGNANCSRLVRCTYNGNGRTGPYIAGDNANAGTIDHPNANNNGQFGWYVASGAGWSLTGSQSANNGLLNSGLYATTAYVFNKGYYWSVLPGQAAGAAENEPVVGSPYWYRSRSADAAAANIPQWVQGGPYVDGGAGYIDSSSVHHGAYAEGTQPPYWVGSACILTAVALDCGKAGPGRLITVVGAGGGGAFQADGPIASVSQSAGRAITVQLGDYANDNRWLTLLDANDPATAYYGKIAGGQVSLYRNNFRVFLIGTDGSFAPSRFRLSDEVGNNSRRRFIGAGPPTAQPMDGGYWQQGDRIENENPAVGQPTAWWCTVSGNASSAGTWVAGGVL